MAHWTYIQYGDPSNFFVTLPPESECFDRRFKSTYTSTESDPDSQNPQSCKDNATALDLSNRRHIPSTHLVPLSTHVTLRPPRLHLTHAHFTPYIPPPPSGNPSRPPQLILSLRNPLPPCQGICSLNAFMKPYPGPVFIASQEINPLQQCTGIVVSKDGFGKGVESRCGLVLCTYCVRFLEGWFKGRVGRMVKWWKRWLEMKDEEARRMGEIQVCRWDWTWNLELKEVRKVLKRACELEEEEEKRKVDETRGGFERLRLGK